MGGSRELKYGEFCGHDMTSSYVITLTVLKAIINPQEIENVLKSSKGRGNSSLNLIFF